MEYTKDFLVGALGFLSLYIIRYIPIIDRFYDKIYDITPFYFKNQN